MPKLKKLLEDSKNSYFKLLILVGNNQNKKEEIISYLEKKDWTIYDVEEIVLDLIENIPEDKIKLRIGSKIKEWTKQADDDMVLTNTNVLYSEEIGTNPYNAFKYQTRAFEEKQGVLLMDGRIRDNIAIYSQPGKPDYAEMELNDVIYEELENVKIMEGFE